MLNMKDLGAQSYCYRHFKQVPDFISQLKKTGLSVTEICGIQVDFSKQETFAPAIQQFNDAGVRIVSIGVQRLANQPELETKYFEFCKASGAKYMSVTFPPSGMWDAFRTAERLADKYDVNLAIHNHGGYDWLGNSTILEYIFSKTSKRIGLCLDTAWAMDAKQDSIEMANKFADRLYGVHIKDFVFDRARRQTDVVVGTGNLDLPKFLSTLKQNKFAGYTVLEYEGDVENPVPALADCVKAVQAALPK